MQSRFATTKLYGSIKAMRPVAMMVVAVKVLKVPLLVVVVPIVRIPKTPCLASDSACKHCYE